MEKKLLCVVLGALCFVMARPVAAQEEQGRNPEDRVELEGHFGLYTNLAFPATRRENPAYTGFLETRIPPEDHALFRPDLRARSLRWQGGVRASYDLTPRWAVEYGFTFTQGGSFKFNDAYVETVIPQAQAANPNISVAELRRADGGVWVHSLNVVFHTRQRGRWVPYLTGGVNAIRFGHGPRVDVVRADPPGLLRSFFERGQFSYDNRFTRLGGNVGGGVKYYWRRHFGFRADARFLFVDSEFTQGGRLVSVATGPGPPPFGPIPRFGPDITSQQRGLYSNLHVTFGVFGRF